MPLAIKKSHLPFEDTGNKIVLADYITEICRQEIVRTVWHNPMAAGRVPGVLPTAPLDVEENRVKTTSDMVGQHKYLAVSGIGHKGISCNLVYFLTHP